MRQTPGRRFVREVTAALEFEPHEAALLEQAAKTLDIVQALQADVDRLGTLTPDGRVQPALTELRQQRLTFARLIASLRLPDEYGAVHLNRGQRRGGARGTYVAREELEALRRAKAN